MSVFGDSFAAVLTIHLLLHALLPRGRGGVLLNSAVAEFTCEGAGYFPHPSDCSQFFRCTDIFANGQYQQYMFTCAEGTVFDASIRTSQRRGMIC